MEIKEKLELLPLWKLIQFTAQVEKQFIEKKKSGMKNISSLKKTKWIKNTYRKVLLEKLKEWEKNPTLEGISYYDLQEDLQEDLMDEIELKNVKTQNI